MWSMGNSSTNTRLPIIRVRRLGLLRLGAVAVAFKEFTNSDPKEELASLVGPDRLKYFAMRSAAARSQFAAGRAALNCAMGGLGYNTSAFRICYDSKTGKPAFESRALSVNFSISHTQGLACCVASPTCVVGCDCERWDRQVDLMAAADFMGKSYHSAGDFLADWTRLESMVKMSGHGLPLQSDIQYTHSFPFKENAGRSYHGCHLTFDVNGEYVFSFCAELLTAS